MAQDRPAADLIQELMQNPAALAMLKQALQAPPAETAPAVTTRFMINVKTGALVNATPLNVNNLDLVKYTGSMEPPITPEEGMAWYRRAQVGGPDSGDQEIARIRSQHKAEEPATPPATFDVDTASEDELKAFASSTFNVDLDPKLSHQEMQDTVRELQKQRG